MKKENAQSQIEVFICNHKKEFKEDCSSKGSKELTDDLKKWAKERPDAKVKIYRSGCLGRCSEGIAILCYPKKEFLIEIKASDAEEIKEIIIKELR